jgi:hypothetical protein
MIQPNTWAQELKTWARNNELEKVRSYITQTQARIQALRAIKVAEQELSEGLSRY